MIDSIPADVTVLVEIRDLEKCYGKQRVLSVPQLTLRRGEHIAITGANGSGKSTLLRVIAGVTQPSVGRVSRRAAPPGPRIGYVPQSGGLYPDLTVEENLKLRRALWLRKRLSANSAPTVAALDLQGTLERTPAELSGGLQRLATIAAALHVEPDWLLLDEPFQGLDPRRRTLLVEHLALISARLQLLVITAPAENDFGLLTKTIRMVGGRIE